MLLHAHLGLRSGAVGTTAAAMFSRLGRGSPSGARDRVRLNRPSLDPACQISSAHWERPWCFGGRSELHHWGLGGRLYRL